MIRLPARLIVTVLLAAGFGAAAYSAHLGSRPAEEWIRTLDGETRVSTLKIDEVVTAMRLETGQIVADIGAGTGLLSVPVAKAVGPRGRVFAVEVDEGFFPAIKKRADDHAVKNIQPVLGAFTEGHDTRDLRTASALLAEIG